MVEGLICPFSLAWSRYPNNVQGYNLHSVAEAALWDVTKSPPQIADPSIIKITSGTSRDPDPPDNSDAADLISVIPPYGTQTLIEVAKDVRIGQQFKFDICVIACDGCAGRKIRQRDCVVIVVAEC